MGRILKLQRKNENMHSTELNYRHEYKYLISEADMAVLKLMAESIMTVDSHADDEGRYLIRSIYFDDLYDTCMSENEDGTSPREKWRIRAYNCDRSNIYLECKRKEGGLIHKDSCRITYDEYEYLVGYEYDKADQRKVPGLAEDDRTVLNRFKYLVQTQGYTPKVIVEYIRYPFVYFAGNVRVTFDTDIASSSDINRFFDEDIHKRMILPIGQQLLEVKYDELLPDYIKQALSVGSLERATFSKYFLCRRYDSGGLVL